MEQLREKISHICICIQIYFFVFAFVFASVFGLACLLACPACSVVHVWPRVEALTSGRSGSLVLWCGTLDMVWCSMVWSGSLVGNSLVYSIHYAAFPAYVLKYQHWEVSLLENQHRYAEISA